MPASRRLPRTALLAALLLTIAATALRAENQPWSLRHCIDFALEHSPALAKQKLTVNSQKLERLIAEAAFDTQLKANRNSQAQQETEQWS